MINSTASRLLFASLVGVCILVGYSGQSRADDPPPDKKEEPPVKNDDTPAKSDGTPDKKAEPQDKKDDTSDKALQDQVRALQQRVDDLSKKVEADKAGSAQPPKPATDQPPGPSGTTNVDVGEGGSVGPPPLTWKGITISGTVDVGIAHLTHGAPLSNTYGPSLPFVLAAYSNRPITSLANNGLSTSKLGISGAEPLGVLDLKGVFKLETGFQPTSGRLSDGPQSLVDNNGLANDKKISSGDSSRAGQAFQNAAYVGVSSKKLGTLTFGRQLSLMGDALAKYDPQPASLAFSPIAFSGTAGGFGDTEDKNQDDTLKYTFAHGPVRLAVSYQFGKKGFEPEGSISGDIGVNFAGLSVDATYGVVRGAIFASSLTAAQNAMAPGTLAGRISDNTGYSLMGSYHLKPVKIYAGYEHMRFANPKDPLPNGSVTIGSYVLSTVNNTTFTIHRNLEYSWLGVIFSATSRLELTAAYYHFQQNSYNANQCTDNSAGNCSGTLDFGSAVADYRLSRRFDVYAGINYTTAANGMASGFLFTNNMSTMVGFRFTF
jgi:predicted porin